MRISDWSSDVCSSDLRRDARRHACPRRHGLVRHARVSVATGADRQPAAVLPADALIFDFDGVLLESEYAGNAPIARYLTAIGHPHTPAEAMATYKGLAGADFVAAVDRRSGRPLPPDFPHHRPAANSSER